MCVLLMNCFHWTGYHLANQLLENGYEVDGIALGASSLPEHLSMFLGRNSAFTLKTELADEWYETAITVGGNGAERKINARRLLFLHGAEGDQSALNTTVIHTPLLFGEWMPMNAEGMYWKGHWVRFDSDFFQNEAVYIKDFNESVFQLMQTKELPARLKVKQKTAKSEAVTLENTVYLRNNEPKKENLQQVLNHYDRFQQLYDER